MYTKNAKYCFKNARNLTDASNPNQQIFVGYGKKTTNIELIA
jgi:hypothetical protein